MKKWLTLLLCLLAAPAFAKPALIEILKTDKSNTGQPIQTIEDPHVRVTEYTMQPGEPFPVHKHPYQRGIYVIEGEIDAVYPETKERYHYEKGDYFIETQDEWHYGENNGKGPVRLLVIDTVPKGSGNNVILK